jgi:hypothetical protein
MKNRFKGTSDLIAIKECWHKVLKTKRFSPKICRSSRFNEAVKSLVPKA